MGRVVNKSFKQVKKDIAKKSRNLYGYLATNFENISADAWTTKQNKVYEKLNNLCHFLVEEIDNLDEIEVPEYE